MAPMGGKRQRGGILSSTIAQCVCSAEWIFYDGSHQILKKKQLGPQADNSKCTFKPKYELKHQSYKFQKNMLLIKMAILLYISKTEDYKIHIYVFSTTQSIRQISYNYDVATYLLNLLQQLYLTASAAIRKGMKKTERQFNVQVNMHRFKRISPCEKCTGRFPEEQTQIEKGQLR